MKRDIVVTGIGAVTPLGVGARTLYERWRAGASGIEDGVGACTDFDPTEHLSKKEARRADRFTQFAMVASDEALREAGWADELPYETGRVGCIIGTGIGGIGILLEGQKTLDERGPRRVSPFMLPHMLPDSASGQVAIQYGIRGPNMAVVSACATGGHAIGEAMETIVRGQADIMLGAGTEAPLVPLAFAGFGQMRALGTPIDPDTGEYNPAMASRPFDRTRNGFVVSEGSAVLVLEELQHALARGARPIAEVIGYGSSADAFDMAAPAERGEGNQRAMRAALARAGIGPQEVDYINAHGTSTPLNDRFETMAIREVFGEHADRLAVSSTKSMTGHAMGAAGAIEAYVCVKTITTGCIPPTINYRHPDPELTLDYVPNEARAAEVRVALSNSMGLGGHNSSVIFRRYED